MWNNENMFSFMSNLQTYSESDGNMFNPIFKENVLGRKHRGSGAFADPELLSYRKPKRIAQNEKNGHKNSNNKQSNKRSNSCRDRMPLPAWSSGTLIEAD